MNYMEQVAEMLGVKLDEEFNVEEYGDDYTFKLTKDGLRWMGTNGWQSGYFSLEDILCDRMDIIKKPVLDETERKYLSNVLKPFRNHIIFICKSSCAPQEEWLRISFVDRGWLFPPFEAGTMYKGMEPNREYTLEELGL